MTLCVCHPHHLFSFAQFQPLPNQKCESADDNALDHVLGYGIIKGDNVAVVVFERKRSQTRAERKHCQVPRGIEPYTCTSVTVHREQYSNS